MPAYVYANGQYHSLAGNKIVKDGALLDMKATDKIILNGAAYNLGAATTPVVIPDIPAMPEVPESSDSHNNGTEPTTGTAWYITPDGAGNKDGTSWTNAAAISQIHVLLLSCASGDRFYFSEGEYTTNQPISIPEGVNFYGGFAAASPAWSTRNGFTHQTKFTGDKTFLWMGGTHLTYWDVDGFVIDNYTAVNNGSRFRLRNSIIRNTPVSGQAENCVFISSLVQLSKAKNCNAFGGTFSVNSSSENSSDTVNVYGTEEYPVASAQLDYAINCAIVNTGNKSPGCFRHNAVNCKAVNCTNIGTGAIFYQFNTLTNCKAINCYSSKNIFEAPMGSIKNSHSCSVTNCTAFNCTSNYGNVFYYADTLKNVNATRNITFSGCNAINCSQNFNSIFYICISGDYNASAASELKFSGCNTVNCTSASIFYNDDNGARNSSCSNCKAVNCITSGRIYNSTYIENCIAVNCSGKGIFYATYSLVSSRAINCNSTASAALEIGSVFYSGYKLSNCIAVNCSYSSFYNIGLFAAMNDHSNDITVTNCTAVNCIVAESNYAFQGANYHKNCLSWNNNHEFFSGSKFTCAGSAYNNALALTLGTDNSIARFTNTGFAPAQGVQDVGECPNPIDDPTGYNTWLAAFGDWHPAADSFLLGAGTADENVTTDLDGTIRPNPPSIGAYEVKS